MATAGDLADDAARELYADWPSPDLVGREAWIAHVAAAMEKHHLARCRAALGEPPVDDARLEGLLKWWLSEPDKSEFLTHAGVGDFIAAYRHYRDLAMAAVTDHGASEMYERGRKAGLAVARKLAEAVREMDDCNAEGGCSPGGLCRRCTRSLDWARTEARGIPRDADPA